MLVDESALTVSQLNGYIRDVINMGFPQSVWVCGEVQGFNRNREKNHVFFELCEKDPESKDMIARIGLVIFANRKPFIDEILKSAENAFELRDDIEVKFLCKVDFYPPHGALRLVVESIDPVYTLGKIAQEKQRLIALLKKQGVLDKNKSLAFPLVPLTLGLITSYDSAAYNDFLAELKGSGFGFRIFLVNTLMQGKGAEDDVCRALTRLNDLSGLGVIVITRGGGSLADLSCFDSVRIAQSIAQSQVPVLSGIGHEINITITDLAAHTFAKTPTAVAQFIAGLVENFVTELEEKGNRIIDGAQTRLDAEKKKLKATAMGLAADTATFLAGHEQQMMFKAEVVCKGAERLLTQAKVWVSEQREGLIRATFDHIDAAKKKMATYKRLVEIVHPHNTLRRGFSITKNAQGALVRSVRDVRKNDVIRTTVPDGIIESDVQITSALSDNFFGNAQRGFGGDCPPSLAGAQRAKRTPSGSAESI